MIYYLELCVVPEEPDQLDLFGHHEGEPYNIFLPADSEHDIHHHFQHVHKRDDIRYKILEVFETWQEAEDVLSLPTITKQ